MLALVKPAQEYLAAFLAALRTGWSGDTERTQETAARILDQVRDDASPFLLSMEDFQVHGEPVKLLEGFRATRLPSVHRWLWDGEFLGSINFRGQRDTPKLPPHVLGHIGYSVVPWKRGQGYATHALGLFLDEIRAFGLPYIEITSDRDNEASQRVAIKNGGMVPEEFTKPVTDGSKRAVRFRIALVALFIVVVAGGLTPRGLIAAPRVDPALCNSLVKNTPAPDVAYQPGIDADGHAVAPADLAGNQQIKLPPKIQIPLTLDLAHALGLNGSHYPANQFGAGTEVLLGTISVDGNSVLFNGEPLPEDQQDKLAVLCMHTP